MLTGAYRVPSREIAMASAVRDHDSAAMETSPGTLAAISPSCVRRPSASAVIDLESNPALSCRKRSGVAADCRHRNIDPVGDDYDVLLRDPRRSRRGVDEAAGLPGVPVTRSACGCGGASAPKINDGPGGNSSWKRLVLQSLLKPAWLAGAISRMHCISGKTFTL